MKDFNDKLAVVTGGGTGMGRELVLALVADGARVAMCDVMQDNMDETARLAAQVNSAAKVTSHLCDVSNEDAMNQFRDDVMEVHASDHIHLLFNNAGIGGGGSFVAGERDDWERTFGVCWYGVYYGSRAFLPLLIASDEGHIVNTSSVNGFWASIGHMVPHTAYAAAKFAVKGFTEALINDLRLNAPHVGVSLVMPGHIGTSIAINSGKVLGHNSPQEMTADEIQIARERMIAAGLPVDNEPDDHIRAALAAGGESFRDNAPMTAASAAKVILDGVRENRWRILVGDDAAALDRHVRADPEAAYDSDFMDRLLAEGHFGGLSSATNLRTEQGS